MVRLTSNLVYLSRSAWGADAGLPRLGYLVPKGRRTHLIQHHTVGEDDDDTPTLWETEAEVKQEMRRLQTIRWNPGQPDDLGADVPYNFVFFCMKNGDLYVCEGRGEDRTGAHTAGHNTEGIGCAWHANFHRYPFARRYIQPASWLFGWLKNERGMVNLGTVKPAGRDTFGHKDFKNTACPGQHLYDEIGEFTIGGDEMPYLAQETGSDFIWVVSGNWKRYLHRMEDADALGISRDVKRVPAETLKSLGRADTWQW